MKKFLLTLLILVIFSFPVSAGDKPFKINVLKKATAYETDIPVNITKAFELPDGYHEGISIKGDELWLANGKNGKVWIIDLPSGVVTKELENDKTFLETIFFGAGESLWATDWDSMDLCRLKIEDKKLASESVTTFSPAHPAGALWTGDSFYVITWTRSMAGTRYHLLKLDENFSVIKKIRIVGIEEPSQMAWDGKFLWISSWFSRRVYKVDPSTAKLLGHFRTGIEKTTGIYYDGRYFWFTGTKEGLYKAEILEK